MTPTADRSQFLESSTRASSPFAGLSVALATTFCADGTLDLPAFRRLTRRVVAGGAQALVVLGSTGEAATLLEVERDQLITACLEEAGDAVVIVGTGSNATHQAAAWTLRAQALGAHGALVVTPYYNKPNVDGLVAHYRVVADAAPGLPIVLYNVPGRTGLNLAPEILTSLWAIPSVVAVKESSGDLAQIDQIVRALPAGKLVLAGDDALALPAIALGAHGLVSVAANLVPEHLRALVDAARASRFQEARRLHARAASLFDALFTETNPVPLKAVLALRGLATDVVRPPLARASEATRLRLSEVLARFEEGVAA